MERKKIIEMTEAEFKQTLCDSGDKYGIHLDGQQLRQIFTYKQLLMEWNKKMNLTAIEEDRDIIYKHFIDSLIVEKYIDKKDDIRLIDVGTGAGFPGIPLKIIRPFHVTLLDSLAKRLAFLDHVIKELDLKGIETIHMRAEDGGRKKELREAYDVAVARAVAQLPVLLEYCTPYVKVGGIFIAMKGNNADQEITDSRNAAKELGMETEMVKQVELSEIYSIRTIIIFRKIRHLSTRYPRKPGIPIKSPI